MATATPTPGDDRRREMSPDEKLIAQWEAQHDVAARGHRGDPLGLQRSISRERLADCARRGSTASGIASGIASGTASRTAAARQAEDRAESTSRSAVGEVPPASSGSSAELPEPARRRHPWWRLRHHAREH